MSLTRKTALKPGGRLKVKGKRRFKAGVDPVYLDWIRTLPCCVSGAWPVVAHHAKGRGVAGTDRQTVPLTDALHREGHQHGWPSFERKYGVNLMAIAERPAETYEGE